MLNDNGTHYYDHDGSDDDDQHDVPHNHNDGPCYHDHGFYVNDNDRRDDGARTHYYGDGCADDHGRAYVVLDRADYDSLAAAVDDVLDPTDDFLGDVFDAARSLVDGTTQRDDDKIARRDAARHATAASDPVTVADKALTDDLAAKLTNLERTWTVKGNHPDYHDRIKRQLFSQWPLLFAAIEDIKPSLARYREARGQ